MSATYPRVTTNFTIEEARFLGWLLADGYYKWSDYSETTSSSDDTKKGIDCTITQSNNKYCNILEADLKALNIDYSIFVKEQENGNHVNAYYIPADFIRNFLFKFDLKGQNKHDVNWLSLVLGMSQEVRDNFVETFYLSDGHDENCITQNYGNIHDAITVALYLQGNRISIQDKSEKCSVIVKHSTRYLTFQKIKKEVSRNTNVFCLTTNNSTFIIRQNKKFISITGNCLYGASGAKIAKMFNVSDEKGKEIVEEYWNTVPALKRFRDDLEIYWEETGQKFIKGIDGRKIRVRSRHSLLNAFLQSMGSMFVKHTVVEISRLLYEQNLLGNPFLDGPGAVKVYQSIVYHDEVQYTLHNSLINVKTFFDPVIHDEYMLQCEELKAKGEKPLDNPFEIEAQEFIKQFKENNKDQCGSIGHLSNGVYYVTLPNVLSRSITTAIENMTEKLKVKVDLGFEFIAGRDWSQCH